MGNMINVSNKEDLEQFRETYKLIGGCKLIHCSQFGDRLESDISQVFYNNLPTAHWLNDDDPLLVNIDAKTSNDDNFQLYTFAKFMWLAEDLRDNPQDIFPQGYRSKAENKVIIHPGSVKIAVMDYMGMDYEVMMWDTGDWWSDVPALTFDEWCDLIPFKKTQVGKVNNVLEVWTDSGFRKKVYNWYYGFNSKVTNDFKIFIGYDTTHSHSAEKCVRSIRKYNKNVQIEFININDIEQYTRPYDKQTSQFTYSRFLVPWLMGYEGVGLFCDDDFIWKCDPLEVLFSLDQNKAVSCVQHNFTKDLSGTKMLDQQNVMYPRKNWSSLMLFNCAHPECANLTLDAVNTKSGQWLHRMMWATDIGKIPHTYNWCEGSCDYCTEADQPMDEAKVYHYTRGGPWVDLSEDWSHIDHIDEWERL